jgi:phosphatidate cytidylyltransferase
MAKEWIDICYARATEGSVWSPSPKPAAMVMLAVVVMSAIAATLDLLGPALMIAGFGALLVLVLTAMKRGLNDLIFALGALYIAVPISALILIAADDDQGLQTVFWVLAIVWATDSVAYAAGRIIGGPKLAPMISPNKTWSGLIGGLTGAALVGLGAGYFDLVGHLPRFILLCLALSLVAQGGDLLESMIKRHFDVKDSGTIIPGHGGVLDRLDSLIVAFPAVACVYLLAGSGDFIWR